MVDDVSETLLSATFSSLAALTVQRSVRRLAPALENAGEQRKTDLVVYASIVADIMNFI